MPVSTVDKRGRIAASWVAVSKTTGCAVFETFSIDTANAINQEKYGVVPVYDYLVLHNERINEAINGHCTVIDT